MKVTLFDFQKDALSDLRKKLTAGRMAASVDNPQAISFSAPTGAGKTIVMTALFENILFGVPGFPPQPDAVILWISDMPELNEQSRLKIEGKSDRIRVRQLVTIGSAFDKPRLPGGCVYFVNTQKLGSDKLLTQKGGDRRQYSIWETFTNTATAIPDRFYVVIDEAHRGMRGRNGDDKAKPILQRFLLGSEADGLCRMPLVIGMSATPKRFEELLAGTTHTVHKVYVPAEPVRKSGLLKDRILIHYPDSNVNAEMTLLGQACSQWQNIRERWTDYCKKEREAVISPILVVQVEDSSEKALTKTDLTGVLSEIESTLGRRLHSGEAIHTFNDAADLPVGNRKIRRVDASRIQDDPKVTVVLFKMSLSTGWDCPRAEVMMSFRRASDHTYIAQLLGRMVRTPLARRVESDAALNDVHLFLPHYDQAAVTSVIEDLKNVEEVPPSEVGTSRELVTLQQRPGTKSIFSATQNLITYRVNAVRMQSGLRRLMGLARALTYDDIDTSTANTIRDLVVNQMKKEIGRLRTTGVLEGMAKNITALDLKTVALLHVTDSLEEDEGYSVETASTDIDRYFYQAGLAIGGGLHMDYWRAQSKRNADSLKVEVIVLSRDIDSMRNLNAFADKEFDRLYEKHKQKIKRLNEQKRVKYDRLRLAASKPEDIAWILPETIDFKRSPNAPSLEKHLYIEDDGSFRADLGPWEREVLNEELSDKAVFAWLRNSVKRPWSLEIPYPIGGQFRPMFPDLLIVRKDSNGFSFDILEPHDPSLADNYAKAIGLAQFAEKHWDVYDRIQLIRKKKGSDGKNHYFRLDLGKQAVRKKVLRITNNSQLDEIFESLSRTGTMASSAG